MAEHRACCKLHVQIQVDGGFLFILFILACNSYLHMARKHLMVIMTRWLSRFLH